MAFAHFGNVGDMGFEGREIVLRLAAQRDHREDGNREAEAGGIEIGVIAADHTRFLQRTHAAQAGRRCEADAFGELDVGHAPILLQMSEDLTIDPIERHCESVLRSAGVTPSGSERALRRQPQDGAFRRHGQRLRRAVGVAAARRPDGARTDCGGRAWPGAAADAAAGGAAAGAVCQRAGARLCDAASAARRAVCGRCLCGRGAVAAHGDAGRGYVDRVAAAPVAAGAGVAAPPA
ncbi:hypothetical protein WR25_10395 [Diploscapter pachys]|uniref:Uncharacterized protein n=1 Tax=Diploscapter pachys TaxID=2018661 RepID=A0A2A2KLW8_9BILA|nr:hypothetical protein WR25_10395 [Diploscapter pachys]